MNRFFNLILIILAVVFVHNAKFVYAGVTQISCSIDQITDTMDGGSDDPDINSDGSRIVFLSNRDLAGGNGDGNQELFLFDTDTSMFTQITNTTSTDSILGPVINSDGTRIVLLTRRNLTGSNPDLTGELFLFDTDTSMFTQITDTGGTLTLLGDGVAINSDGTRIAFAFFNDITGGNVDGNAEIFLFDTDTSMFTQITVTMGGGNFAPSINSDGTLIAFVSDNNFTDNNADGNFEIFLFDTDTSMFTQITDTITGMNFNFSGEPSINSDGTRIAFNSSGNLTGGNDDGSTEIFLFDTDTDMFTQITTTDIMGGE